MHSECFFTKLHRTPQNSNVPNGETKIASVRRHYYFYPMQTWEKRDEFFFFFKENCVAQYCYLSQDMTVAVSNPREPESEEKPQKSLNEKQLVSCHSHTWVNLGSSCYYYLYGFPF